MTRLEWDPTLDTGDQRIDAEHKHLFELFNQIDAAADEGRDGVVRDTLEELTAYVATHFDHEESRMRESGFPEAALTGHVEEHRALTENVRDYVLEYRTGKLRMSDLVGLLRSWLSHHVDEIDRAMVDHLNGNRGRS